MNSDEELAIPGFKNLYPAKLLPRLTIDQTATTKFFFECISRIKETSGIMVNTFVELEPFALQSLLDLKIVPQIYPVGPMANFKEGGHGRNNQSETESIIKWLDEQPKSSVVFLCFGSLACFEPEQVKEIAIAMECSGYRFLWSLRRPPPKGKMELPSNYENFDQVLPEGFIERTNGVGKVIGWAPQVAVLSHPTQMNAFSLVKELGLAVEIRIDYFNDFEGTYEPDGIVRAKEIESGIGQLMEDCSKNEVRRKAKEMKEEQRNNEGGWFVLCISWASN
nr:UDP-glycosyltransferase [Nicotiana tabacum]